MGNPILEYFGTATAVLGWPPRDFWTSTPIEFFAAIRSWRRANDPKAVEKQRHADFKKWAREMDPDFE